MMLRRLSLLVVLFAAACATRDASLPPAQPFDLYGRVSVSYDGRAFSSGLRWRHTRVDDEISLLTPLGQTLAHIVNSPDGATLTASDQRRFHAASVESLTRQAFGWELPVAGLRFWLRGEPVPGSEPTALQRDAQARLAVLEQDGWRIVFTHYPPAERGGRLRRLDLDHGTQKIRLVIDEWQAAGAAP